MKSGTQVPWQSYHFAFRVLSRMQQRLSAWRTNSGHMNGGYSFGLQLWDHLGENIVLYHPPFLPTRKSCQTWNSAQLKWNSKCFCLHNAKRYAWFFVDLDFKGIDWQQTGSNWSGTIVTTSHTTEENSWDSPQIAQLSCFRLKKQHACTSGGNQNP